MTPQPDEPVAAGAGAKSPSGNNEQDQLAAIARSEFHNRRRRDSLIAYDLFAEPAWDMLLDLYIQHHRRHPVAIDRLCAVAATASTTALRWVGLLIEKELVTRSPCAADDDVVRVTLSARGISEMERYLRGFLSRDRRGEDIAAAPTAR